MAMISPPPWDEVQRRLGFREAHAVLLSEEPRVLFLVQPTPPSIALLVETDDHIGGDIQPARGLRIQAHGVSEAAIWIDDDALLEPGLDFLAAIARRVTLEREPLLEGVDAEIERWRALVAHMVATETVAAVGVLGELAVVRAAVELGHDPSCWAGGSGGAIDFRFSGLECEVKTTTGNRHEHVIHGADQLMPSPGHRLYLVSLMLARSERGVGVTVRDMVDELRAYVPDLVERLRAARAVELDDPAASVPYVLRASPLAVAVDDEFPALTSARIRSALGPEAERLRDISYRLLLDGLPATDESRITRLLEKVRLGGALQESQ
jgi:hypothetical protein